MKSKLIIVLLLAFVSSLAYAAPAPAETITADSVLSMIQGSMAPAVNKLTTQAITWLAVFSALQFLLTNLGLLKSGADIEAVLAKGAGSILWMAVCVFLINNAPEWIGDVGAQMFDLLGVTLPSPGGIIASTIALVSTLGGIAVTVGVASTTAGMLLVYMLLFILAVGMFFAFKIFMIQLELGLVVMLSPLSFSFLGLNALKDQGIAPFKALISLAYRILLMTLILSAFSKVNSVATASISSMTATSVMGGLGQALMIVLSALGAYIMLAYIFFKSDSIAATLANGSTGMGPADVAGAAAAGAAAGAAVASGGASIAGLATKAPQGMGEVIKQMMGNGSISNASSRGKGGQEPSGDAPRRGASMSTQSTGAATAPVRTDAATGPAGTSQGGAQGRSAPGGSVGTRAMSDTSGAPTRPAPEPNGSPGDDAGSAIGSGNSGQSSDDGSNSTGAPTRVTAGEKVSTVGSGSGRNLSDAPVRPSSTANTSPPVRSPASSPGDGSAAGIGGAPDPLTATLDKLNATLEKNQPRKPGLRDHVKDLGQHVEREKAHTSVSINTHHSD